MLISTHNKGIFLSLSEFYLVNISDYAPLSNKDKQKRTIFADILDTGTRIFSQL